MKKSNIDKLTELKGDLKNSIQKVSKENNAIDWSREEAILSKLQGKLGKSRDEVKKLMSDGLLTILSKVPFTINP